MSRHFIQTLLLSSIFFLSAPYSSAQDRSVSLSFGTFGVLDTEELFEVGLEYRLAPVIGEFRPIVGASILQDGGNYIYAGTRYEHELAPSWFVAPSFAAGIYSPGSIDLGGPVEFRSGLDIGHDVTNELALSIGFYHLSNGGIYSKNGGSESLVFSVTYGF